MSSYIIIGIIVILVVAYLLLQKKETPNISSNSPPNLKLGPVRHTNLTADLEARIQRFEPILTEVYPSSHEEWIEGFKRDLHPESEVAIWESMASAYQNFIEKHTLDLDAKKEAFGLLLVRSGADEKTTLSGAKLHYLNKAEAEEVVRGYSDTPKPIQVQKN